MCMSGIIRVQIKIWKHKYFVKMGMRKNGKIGNYKNNRKIWINIFNTVLKDTFLNISAQAKIVNEEMNIFD